MLHGGSCVHPRICAGSPRESGTSRVGKCGKTSVRSVPSSPHESLNRPDNHDPSPSDPGFLRSLNLLVEGSTPSRLTSLRSPSASYGRLRQLYRVAFIRNSSGFRCSTAGCRLASQRRMSGPRTCVYILPSESSPHRAPKNPRRRRGASDVVDDEREGARVEHRVDRPANSTSH